MKDQSPPKKLTRSRSDRYIGGVAAGLAERFHIDPIFVRIAFVASLVFGGLGLLAYVAMLIAVPIDGDTSEPLPSLEPRRRNMMIGLAVIVGFVFLVTADTGGTAAWLFGFWPGTVFGVLFWVAAAGLATWLVASGFFTRDRDDAGSATPPAAPKPEPTTDSPAEATTEVVTYAESPTQLSRTEVMETRQMEEPVTEAEVVTDSTDERVVRDDGPSTIGRIMTWFAIGVTGLIVFCLLFVFSAGVTATLGGVPMAALVIVLGAGMVFAGLRGRRQLSGWLLAAAIAVTLPMAAVSIADLRVEGSYGDIKEAPMSVLDIPDGGYEMAAGSSVIDLRTFDFESKPVSLPVKSGMGLTSVIVPDQICVTGSVRGKAGVISWRGIERNGVDVDFVSQSGPKLVPGSRFPLLQLTGDFKLGAFEVVDGTQWQQVGRGGSFEYEGSGMAMAAQNRAKAACSLDDSSGRIDPKVKARS